MPLSASLTRLPLSLARLLAFSALGLTALAGPARADIRVMAVGPMSGPYQALGKQIRSGVEMAVDALNATGGIQGERIVVDIEDDACKADNALAAANRAVGRGDALVVGHVCAEAALAAAPVYVDNALVAITPAVTADRFTDHRPGPTLFRLAARDDAQGAAAGAFLAERFGGARIAVLNDGSPYGKPLAEATKRAMNEAGKREARADSFDPGAKEYSALADRLIADAIDVVFVGGDQGDTALILKALRAKGSEAVIVGGDALASGEFKTSAGSLADGTLLTFFTDWRRGGAADAVDDALRTAGVEPQGYVLPAYAAVQLWAAARRASGSDKGADIATTIAGTATPTVLGPVGFDAKGDADIQGFSIFRWQDGVLTPDARD
ncbi:branched chain amino acid ABC transporter substrate-binding protein [Kaistia sp. 32K]|uniref:branched-chain amino acid ABC transporter substrate-binding protein n=1 Tax=Kaistia sp. 32K TaxID=2795690 RepID=UPI0019150780|nr:branched-chain amino acid ABC transporter substrate-binding protein [Kaistia sp. 32K]BCP54293.1 branched chain amino acid ABC transporter substrate-binding protein [Kaistia sp. 32K]